MCGKELKGKRFGKLQVIEYAYTSNHKERVWNCKCDCGNFHYATSYNLEHCKTVCCTKCKIEKIAIKNTTHGQMPKTLYRAYTNMENRCNNPNYYLFMHYGGKGIKVCDEWTGKNSFIKFREWAFSNGWKKGLSLDRIDNSKNYCPENCRWVTMEQQQNNRTNNRIIDYNGKKYTMANLCKAFNSKYANFQYWYLKKGVSVDEALLHSKRI